MPDIFVAEHKRPVAKKEEGIKEAKTIISSKNPHKSNHFARFVNILTRNNVYKRSNTLQNVKLFSTFRPNPVGITFQEKEEDENVLLFLRRHIVTNIPWFFFSIIFLLIPLILAVINSQLPLLGFLSFLNLPAKFILIFIIFYYSIILTYIFVNFINWYFNISLVTDKRVVDVDFSGLVYKNVAATKLTLLQDASYTQTGVIRSIFNYGDVLLQTAGSLENFDFHAVPFPERVVQIVEALIGKEPHGIFK